MTKAQKLVDDLATMFEYTAPDGPEEVDRVLRDAGYDPDKVAEWAEKVAASALEARQARLNHLLQYLAAHNLEPDQVELVEESEPGRITWYLRRRYRNFGEGLAAGIKSNAGSVLKGMGDYENILRTLEGLSEALRGLRDLVWMNTDSAVQAQIKRHVDERLQLVQGRIRNLQAGLYEDKDSECA